MDLDIQVPNETLLKLCQQMGWNKNKVISKSINFFNQKSCNECSQFEQTNDTIKKETIYIYKRDIEILNELCISFDKTPDEMILLCLSYFDANWI